MLGFKAKVPIGHPLSPRNAASAALRGLYRGSANAVLSFRELDEHELKVLASVLAHQPSPQHPISSQRYKDYDQLVREDIKKLPATLLAAKRHSSEFKCSTHARLNLDIAGSIVYWLREEVDVGIPGLLYALRKSNLLDKEVESKFEPLKEISGMWGKPRKLDKIFGSNVPTKWSRQDDKCPACILARIGGEVKVMTALKAGLIARTSSSKLEKSRRHKYVEFVIQTAFEKEQADKILAEAQTLGLHLKEMVRCVEDGHGSRRAKASRSHSLDHRPNIPQQPAKTPIEPPAFPPKGRSQSHTLPESDLDKRAPEALAKPRSTLDDLIDEYRRTFYIPQDETPLQLAREADLEQYPFTADRPSFDGSARASNESPVSALEEEVVESEGVNGSNLYMPGQQSSEARAKSYTNLLDVDAFLDDVEAEQQEELQEDIGKFLRP